MQVTQHKPSNAKKQKENKYSSQAEPVRAKKGKNTSDIKFRYKENTSAYSNVFTKDPNLKKTPRIFEEVPPFSDWENLFVIQRVRFNENSDLTNFGGKPFRAVHSYGTRSTRIGKRNSLKPPCS